MKILVVDTSRKVTTTLISLIPCVPGLDLETAGRFEEAQAILSQGGVLVAIIWYDPSDKVGTRVGELIQGSYSKVPYIVVADLNRAELLDRGGTEALRLLNGAVRFLSSAKLSGWADHFMKVMREEVTGLAVDRAVHLVREMSDAFKSGERPATTHHKPFEDKTPKPADHQ